MSLQGTHSVPFPSCLIVSRVIEKGKVALDQPGKGVSLWATKHNCPFYSGLEARAGRENFLPEHLLLAKGEMKCHANYPGSGQCEENWLQLCEAAARAPITEWGWGGFLCCWLHTADPSTLRATRSGCSTTRLWAFGGDGPRHSRLNQLLLSEHKLILVAFRTNPPEGGGIACLQLISEQWWSLEWCLGAQKAVLCFSVVLVKTKKEFSASRMFKQERDFDYFSAKLGLAKSKTECEM